MAPSGWLALLLIWILFFWLYRDYRLDRFRQKLFALRDEMFDIALEGRVGFSSSAYGMLRSTINGTIQYGHQLGFLDLLTMCLFTLKDTETDRLVTQFDSRWERACEPLDHDTQEQLKSIRRRLHFAIAEQVVFTSFILVFTLVAAVLAALMLILKSIVVRKVDRLLSSSRLRHIFSTLDYSASMHAT